jgi:serine O-acetyltransferase
MNQFYINWFSILKEDVRVFRLVYPSPGLLKYFYQPGFRALLIFRFAQLFFRNKFFRPLSYVLVTLNDLLCGVWIGPRVEAGPGLFLGHPRGLVVNPDTKIGSYCSIIQRVTLGGPNIVIGNFVEINAGAQLISNDRGRRSLNIGSHVIIGAGSIVLTDVPDCSVVVGVPARIVKEISPEDNWINFRQHLNDDLAKKEGSI